MCSYLLSKIIDFAIGVKAKETNFYWFLLTYYPFKSPLNSAYPSYIYVVISMYFLLAELALESNPL